MLSLMMQGLDVKRHNFDQFFAALHIDVDITVVDYRCEMPV